MSDGSLIVAIIGTAITTLGLAAAGLWAYNEAIKRQFEAMEQKATEGFKTLFRRMDENKQDYYKDFVKKEIYDLEIKHQEERNNDKFISIHNLFQTTFNSFEKKFDEITQAIKDIKHKNGEK